MSGDPHKRGMFAFIMQRDKSRDQTLVAAWRRRRARRNVTTTRIETITTDNTQISVDHTCLRADFHLAASLLLQFEGLD